MLTVEKFIELTNSENLELISGEVGIKNEITSVNIMDNPDALDWFSAGEMLLTSGYFFKDNPEVQNNVMETLHALNCPALCIKPDRYLGSIPDNMINLSNKFNLPIIKIPYGVPFSSLFIQVMEELSVEFDSFNRQSLDIHKFFFNVSLHDGGLEEISYSLSSLLSTHILLLDKDWKVLEATEHSKDSRQIFKHLQIEKGRIPFPEKEINQFPPEFQNVETPIIRSMIIEDQKIHYSVLPVFFNHIHYGFISTILSNQNWTRKDYAIMKIASMTYALELIKLSDVERARNRIRRDFLDELLTGKITSREDLSNQASIHGVSLELSYTAVVLEPTFHSDLAVDAMIEQEQFENEKIKRMLSVLDTFNYYHKNTLIIYSRHKKIIILIGTGNTTDAKTPNIKKIVGDMIQNIENKIEDVTLIGGIGRLRENIMDIHESYYEAQSTLSLLKQSANKKIISHYDDYLLRHFLNKNIAKEEMLDFMEEVIGGLITYDEENQSNLVDTLENWISHQMNVSQAAKSMYIHRNTMLYRINKMKELLSLDFEDNEDLLSLQLALNIRHYLNY